MREKERKKEREISLLHFPHYLQGWTKLVTEAGNSISVSHVSARDSDTQAIDFCLPESPLAESWNQKVSCTGTQVLQ